MSEEDADEIDQKRVSVSTAGDRHTSLSAAAQAEEHIPGDGHPTSESNQPDNAQSR